MDVLPTAGDMRDLIVEACIARRLVDLSARVHVAHNLSAPLAPPGGALSYSSLAADWASFMEGVAFSHALWASLVSFPAPGMLEVHRVYETATSGPDDSRKMAAATLCGATLLRGWAYQISPASPGGYVATTEEAGATLLLARAPVLASVLPALAQTEAFNILWLYGKLPELVCLLLPICEYFGSLPAGNARVAGGADVGSASGHAVFSHAVLLILRILEDSYLPRSFLPAPGACPGETGGDHLSRMQTTMWDVMMTAPGAAEAMISAFAQGQLSSHALLAGLKELVELVPAGIGSVATYLAGEAVRGTWKVVACSGGDWPKPGAQQLAAIDAEVRTVLAQSGVGRTAYFPDGSSLAASMPLPMAALMSLVLAIKSEAALPGLPTLWVARPIVERAAATCPSPTVQTAAALWAIKVRQWHRGTVIAHAAHILARDRLNSVELLRGCFSAALPRGAPPTASSWGCSGGD
eukprot:jgi/Mesen1/4186/ME000219S03315